MDPTDLSERILRFLDGDLSPDEERELAKTLRENPDAQPLLAELMRLHGQIPTVLQEEQAGRPAGGAGRPSRTLPAPRRRRLWIGGAAAGLAAAAGAVFLLSRPPDGARQPVGRVLAAAEAAAPGGTAAILRGEDRLQLQAGQDLFSGDRVETAETAMPDASRRSPAGAEAAAVLELSSGCRLELAGATRLRLCRPDERPKLELPAGRLTADVSPQPPGRPFIVKTPQGETEVIGTKFTLAVAAGATRLDVHEGRVRLRKAPRESGALVEAGFTATAAEGIELAPRPLAAPPAAAEAVPVGNGLAKAKSRLAVKSPAAHSVCKGEITFATDLGGLPGVASVQYLLNGKPLYEGGDPAKPVTAAPYSYAWHTGTVWDGFMTVQAVARDAKGNVLDTSAPVPFQIANGSVKLTLVSPAPFQTVSGKVNWTLSTDMDASVGNPVYACFIDGRQTEIKFGGKSFTMPVDTTRMANGTHELFCALYAETKSSGVPPFAMSHVLIDVQNGRAFRELRANYREVFLTSKETATLRARAVCTNGDEAPAEATYSSSDASVAAVSDNGTVTGVAPGIAVVTVKAGESSAKVRVTVDPARICPHFAADGKVLTAYTPGKSMFLRSMFWMDAGQFKERPQLGAAAQKAALNALTTGFYHNPGDNYQNDMAAWKRTMDEKLDQQLRCAVENNLGLFLTGDDIARNANELHDSVTNPQSKAKIQYVLEWAKKTGRAVGVDMVDEVDFGWGETPTPANGRWSKYKPPLPDDAFIKLMETINGVPGRPPISWPVSGAAGAATAKNWAGNPQFSDFNTIFWHFAHNWRRQYPTHNSCWQPVDDIDRTLNDRLAGLRRDQPLFLLTSAMGPNYWKEVAGEHFVPGRDRMSNAGHSPEAVTVQIMCAVARGMAGVRVYAYDANHCREQRVKTPPGDKRTEPQTGCDPFVVGVARWEAMSQAFNLIKKLEPFVLQPRAHALDLGSQVLTGAREGAAGRLFLATNGAEVPASIRVDLKAYKYPAGPAPVRYRQTTTATRSDPVSGDSDALLLESGETVVYVFPRSTATLTPPAGSNGR